MTDDTLADGAQPGADNGAGDDTAAQGKDAAALAAADDAAIKAKSPPPDESGGTDGADKTGADGAAKDKGDGKKKADDGPLAADAGDGADKDGASDWPEDWRQRLAGDNKSALKTLERIKSPQELWKKVENLQKKVSEGVSKKPDAKDEEALAAWREEQGIPKEADGYIEGLKLSDGRVLGDDDKPVAEYFAKKMHGADITPDQFNQLVDSYYERQEELVAEQIEADKAFKTENRDALRDEWGQEFKANINALGHLFNEAPDGLRDRIFAARDADGNQLGNNAEVIRWMAGLSREMNPAASVVPATSNPGASIDEEIATLEKQMREDRDGWFKDQKAQSRYQQLLDAQDKMKRKSA